MCGFMDHEIIDYDQQRCQSCGADIVEDDLHDVSEIDNTKISAMLTPIPDISWLEGRGGGGSSQEIGDDDMGLAVASSRPDMYVKCEPWNHLLQN